MLLYILLLLIVLDHLAFRSDGVCVRLKNCTDPSKEAKEAEKKINEAELLSVEEAKVKGESTKIAILTNRTD